MFRMVDAVEDQARACARLGSPLYAALLEQAADDVRAGGPCAEVLAGWEEAPRDDGIALRLLGGVHALVLTGRAPELAGYYPSVGGVVDPRHPDAAWPAFRAVVAANRDQVREWLTRPPQTNEVGRSTLLVTGLLAALTSHPAPVRLLEIGASAGLNLRVDHFHYTSDDGLRWGPAGSPVGLAGAWRDATSGWLAEAAARYPAVTVLSRTGCDPDPLDPLTPAGALALRAYVWSDQPARTARLEGALRVAARVPAEVRRVGAADFLSGVELAPGTLTVVWHSVMRQYVPPAEWRLVERELDRLAAASGPAAGFAYLCFEPDRTGAFRLTCRVGSQPGRVLADAPPHGLPAAVLPDQAPSTAPD